MAPSPTDVMVGNRASETRRGNGPVEATEGKASPVANCCDDRGEA